MEEAVIFLFKYIGLIFFSPALNNPQYKVPTQLIQMAQDENRRLQQMRYGNKHTRETCYSVIICTAA